MAKRCCLLVLVFLLTAFASAASAKPPTTGHIEIGFFANERGQKKILHRRHSVWFDATRTRIDVYENEQLVSSRIDGPAPWLGYPRAKRFDANPSPPFSKRPYQEVAKGIFQDHAVAKAQPATVDKFAAWRYDEAKPGAAPDELTSYYFLANSDFPLLLRIENGVVFNMEVTAMDLDCEIPGGIFDCPRDYQPILPTGAPAHDEFMIQFEDKLGVGKDPKTMTRDMYFGRDKIKHYCHHYQKAGSEWKV